MKTKYKDEGKEPTKKRVQEPLPSIENKPNKVSRVKKINTSIQNTNLTFKYKGCGRWAIFEIKEDCDISENYEAIEQEIKSAFGEDTEYFIPVYREKFDSKAVGITLFEGYIFLRFEKNKECLCDLADYNYLEGPLMKGGKISYVSDKEINDLRSNLFKKLQKRFPRKGQIIVPKLGTFKNLEGKVVGVDRKNRVVRAVFKLSSREVVADINVINLDFEENL